MKIAVTGALGHIGSRFIRAMEPGAYQEVLLVDNLSTQRFPSLFDLPSGVPFQFLEEDICSADLTSLFKGRDVVIHLAALTDASSSVERQKEVERVNYEGTRRVAEACNECGCRLLFVSTTSVYGTQEGVVDEDCAEAKLKPQSPYADSKLRAEGLLRRLGPGLRFVTCRFGTIFGVSAGMRFHTAVNKFVWQAVLRQPLTVWRTALNQERPYLDLSDAVRALDFLTRRERFDNEIYNVLTVNATVGEIVAIIREQIPDLEVQYVDSPIMNQLSYTVSAEKFKALGFEFRGDLRRGIGDTVRLFDGLKSQAGRQRTLG